MNNLSKESLEGKFSTGYRELGLIEGVVSLAPINKKIVTDELIKEVEDLQKEIVAGKIDLSGWRGETK